MIQVVVWRLHGLMVGWLAGWVGDDSFEHMMAVCV